MVQLIKRDDVLAYASSVREQIQALKKSHLIFGAIIMLSLFGSYSWRIEVSEEVRDIRNSVQNFYSEFTPYMVSDILEFNRFVERFQKEVDKTDETISGMKEARKASEEFKNQLQIMQNYGHDKTGRADLALYNAGGRIAGIGEEMELFYSCGMFWKIFGCPGRRNGPEKVIQALMYAEECFGFKGKQGAVAIRLPKPAIVDAVTIEHLPREMSPTGEVTSAPRNFSISVSLPCFIARASRAVKREMKKFPPSS